MKKSQIVRAWRDAEYFESLTEAERAQVPANPAGLVEVESDVLDSITGGCGSMTNCSGPNDTTFGSTALCSPCPPCYCL
jgi:mersacidin/lichenicidin family type 2 lantibiotic